MKGINRINRIVGLIRYGDVKDLKREEKQKYKEKETKECMKIRKSIVSK